MSFSDCKNVVNIQKNIEKRLQKGKEAVPTCKTRIKNQLLTL
jgi:hypothetical protein